MADIVKEPEWPRHIALVPNCPLKDAVPVKGRIFRRLDGTPDEWLSYKEQNKKFSPAKLCQATSLSCYTDLIALREMLAVHESWSQVVAADLSEEHGVIKQTGNNPDHHSLWLRNKYHSTCKQMFVAVPE